MIGAVAIVALVAVAAYVVFGPRRPPPAVPAAPAAAPAPSQPARPLGAAADPIALPPLGQTDALVRDLVGKLSAHPTVAAWLATDGLIRNFAYVVDNVADGKAPAKLVPPLRPSGKFVVSERGADVFVDPRSGGRYRPLAEAAASIDPAGAAQLYTLLKPRLEEAYREVAKSDTTFDGRVERAIVLLLQTPVSDEPARVRTKGIGYAFADPGLERLAPAQKQLLRMGPQNARMVQAKLRAIALALGIPEARLP